MRKRYRNFRPSVNGVSIELSGRCSNSLWVRRAHVRWSTLPWSTNLQRKWVSKENRSIMDVKMLLMAAFAIFVSLISRIAKPCSVRLGGENWPVASRMGLASRNLARR